MRQWIQKTLQFCGVAALLAAPVGQAEAISSIKALGMAAASTAYPQDALAASYNPAGIVDVGNRVDAGLVWEHTRGSFTIEGSLLGTVNGTYKSNRHNDYYDPEFGVNVMVCDSCDFALSLVGYNKGHLQTGYNRNLPIAGTSKLGLEVIQEIIAPTAALRFDCHSFGVSLQLAGQRFKASGLEGFDNALFSVSPTHVTNRNNDYAWGVGVVVGWLWHAYEGVSVGFTYEPRTKMGRFKNYSGLLAKHGRLDLPERFKGGVALDFCDWAHVCFDVEYVHWKKVRALADDFPPTFAGIAANKLGTNHGPGFHWRDQWFFRVGADMRVMDDLVVRLGYRHTNTPVRRGAVLINILTLETVENAITTGLTWTPWCGTELSGMYAYGFRHGVRGNQTIDPAAGGGLPRITNQIQLVGISIGQYF